MAEFKVGDERKEAAEDTMNSYKAAQAEVLGLGPREVDIQVVGGHASVTILPLLSQVTNFGATVLSVILPDKNGNTISTNHNWFNGYNLSFAWDSFLRDYNEAKEYIEDIKDLCDDFEALPAESCN